VQAALKSVKGVSKVVVGAKAGSSATTTVTADKTVKVADLIAALKAKGFGATEKVEVKVKA